MLVRLRLAAAGLGVELVGVVAAGAAERDLLGLRVRQIDQIGGGLADGKPVDVAFELACEIIAAVGKRW